MLLKNESGDYPTALTSSVFTFAYATKENQLFWTNSSRNFYGASFSSSNAFAHAKQVAQNSKLCIAFVRSRVAGKQKLSLMAVAELFTPEQIEYDWIGDNIFTSDAKGDIWACGRVSGACLMVFTDPRLINLELRFALDPKRG